MKVWSRRHWILFIFICIWWRKKNKKVEIGALIGASSRSISRAFDRALDRALDGASSGSLNGSLNRALSRFSIGKQSIYLDLNIVNVFHAFTLFMQQQ